MGCLDADAKKTDGLKIRYSSRIILAPQLPVLDPQSWAGSHGAQDVASRSYADHTRRGTFYGQQRRGMTDMIDDRHAPRWNDVRPREKNLNLTWSARPISEKKTCK